MGASSSEARTQRCSTRSSHNSVNINLRPRLLSTVPIPCGTVPSGKRHNFPTLHHSFKLREATTQRSAVTTMGVHHALNLRLILACLTKALEQSWKVGVAFAKVLPHAKRRA